MENRFYKEYPGRILVSSDEFEKSNSDESLLSRIDSVCEAFETQLAESQSPSIRDFLPGWPDHEEAELFRHLLEIEVDWRRRRNESVEYEDYVQQFRKFKAQVELVFQDVNGTFVEQEETTIFDGENRTLATTPYVDEPEDPAPWKTSNQLIPGKRIANRYRIVSILGRGGMGEVYRADDMKLNETVALKILPPNLAHKSKLLELFINEVRLARKVSHPYVCRVFDIGEFEGMHFLTMELIDGEDLKSLLSRVGRLPVNQVLQLTHQICFGLDAAHQNGILHRDLKPANVMIDGNGCARVTDFGLAKLSSDSDTSKAAIGTPAYMAPEQFHENETSERSDIYSLGLIIYEMITGKRAHPASDRAQLEYMLKNPVSPIPIEDHSDAELALQETIQRCLSLKASDRPTSAMDVSSSLPENDPLCVALEAGVTPSPAMVTAAPRAYVPTNNIAWCCFAGTVLLCLFASFLWSQLAGALKLKQSPVVLAKEARQILDANHLSANIESESWGLGLDSEYSQYLALHDIRWDRLAENDPQVTYFWYRSSPQQLVPRIPDWTGESFLIVDEQRPPLNVPGMAWLVTNLGGRLNQLKYIPAKSQLKNPAVEFDGLEFLQSFCDIQSADVRTRDVDSAGNGNAIQRWAWERDSPNIESIQLDLVTDDMVPIQFKTSGDWEDVEHNETIQLAGSNRIRQIFFMVWIPFLFIGGAWMIRRNLVSDRCDFKRAFRLAKFMFCAAMASWLLRDSHSFSVVELDLLFMALAAALLLAGVIWSSYIAIEPDARRIWPHTLIGWNRIWGGKFRDRVVGRELLFGAGAGAIVSVLKLSNATVPMWSGLASDSFTKVINLQPLMGLRFAVGEIVAAGGLGILYALFAQLLFLLLLRVITRNSLIAGGIYVLVMSLMVSAQHHQFWLTFAFTAMEMSLTVYLFLRCGLLSVAVMHFVRLLFKWPVVLNTSWWGSEVGFIGITIVLAVAGLGLYWILRTNQSSSSRTGVV